MTFLKHHWFGFLISVIMLFFVIIFVLVLFSPKSDIKKRGFISCTDSMADSMLSCPTKGKIWCMLKSISANTLCESKVVLVGFSSWIKGEQPRPWSNYLFEPEIVKSQPYAGEEKFYEENPNIGGEMEQLRSQNIQLENSVKEKINEEGMPQ